MSLRVNTNIEAFDAHRNLQQTQYALGKSMQKLSSGLRINSAADDAAGLAISEKMTAQINGTDQAQRNAMDGISLVQTAEGAYNEMHSILQRVRELSVQAQNGTLTSSDTAAIDQEVGQLTAELSRISSNTEFNGLAALSGTFTLQVGADQGSGNQISFSLTSISFSNIGSAASATALSAIDQAITDRLERPLHPRRDPEPARGRGRQPRRVPGEHLGRTEPHPRRRRRRRDGQLHQAADPLAVGYRDARPGELRAPERALAPARLVAVGVERPPHETRGLGRRRGPSLVPVR